MELNAFLRSLTQDERKFIAERDYGVDADAHLSELNKLIDIQAGVFREDQYWYPREVVELASHALVPGHEKEFVACTLLLLKYVVSESDASVRFDWKFDNRAQDYDALPTEWRDAILAAYVLAEGYNGGSEVRGQPDR